VLALGVYLHGVSSNTLEWEMEASGILAEEVANGIPGARENLLREIQYGG
jgi:hypothetical protein